MTAKEAYQEITEKYPMWELYSCREYKTIFTFRFVRAEQLELNPNMSLNNLINNTVSINKETGIIRPFKPIDIPREEFRSGKTVENFK